MHYGLDERRGEKGGGTGGGGGEDKAKTDTKKEILENEPFGSLTWTICCKTLWQLSCNEENRFFLMAYAI